MKTTKKLIFIITTLLAALALVSSCSKNEVETKKAKVAKAKQQAAEKGAKKAAKTSQAAAATTTFSDGKNSLGVARDGQYVTLNWHLDTTIGKIQKLAVLRSPTGVEQRLKVADLDAKTTSFKDCLPDANVYWYWVRVFTDDNKAQNIGPVKVDTDKAGASRYIKPEEQYKASVTRTLDIATIKWDFPDDEYKAISIIRHKRPIKDPFGGPANPTPVLTTLSGKSQSTNALADANSEYWYWFQITLKSGTIVYKGPIKADYVRQSPPASGKK